MIELKIYTPDLHDAWNRFAAECKNYTFLHNRDYMDYHSDRFQDCSLVAYAKGQIIAVLPANRVGNTLYSHQGLTYGGWLIPKAHFDVTNMLDIFDEMKRILPSIGITELVYKAIPHIYHTYPAEEDLYAIYYYGGTLIETNVSTTIELTNKAKFNRNSIRGAAKAKKSGISIMEMTDFSGFWEILTNRLNTKYGVNPVHNIDEINLLQSRFPNNIRLFVGALDNKILGGALIYETPNVIHVQYSASTEEGRNMGVLPLLYKYLTEEIYADCHYFDFGISNEDHGHYLNKGLVMQKTGLGGRAIVHNIYRITF